MPRRWPPLLAATAVSCLVLALPAPASARWFGSTLQADPNATYGCESALVSAPLGGVALQPTGQQSCTYRHAGYLFSNRPTFIAPSSGRITHIRVKAGANPAKLRLTVLTGSSRVDTFSGRDLPGTYTCCTARYVGRPFRPRANRITKKKVDVRVYDVRSKRIQHRIHSSDGLALTAVGPGTLPLNIGPSVGGFDSGTPIATSYFPFTREGEPRVEGYSMTGIDLLFQWNFRGQ
ncbi:MAG: hypothetical protein M3N43_02855 [Actinomycetota bacterium]|nr:hypothetical protein [Actinomycetota bacterium]